MLRNHSFTTLGEETILTAYTAKRRAEAAPGVGQQTDMVIIGDRLGHSFAVDARALGVLEEQWRRIVAADADARKQGREAITKFLDENSKQDVAQQGAASTAPTEVA